jgi:hypothetical protein
MRETFTSGSVGRAPGNRCLYPEPDRLQPTLLRSCGFQWQVKRNVFSGKKGRVLVVIKTCLKTLPFLRHYPTCGLHFIDYALP